MDFFKSDDVFSSSYVQKDTETVKKNFPKIDNATLNTWVIA